MKNLFGILLALITVSICAQNRDTTIKYDLNFDGRDEIIKCSYHESTYEFTLQIGSAAATGTFAESYDMGIEIIDINKNDNLREVVLKGYGNSDQNDMYFFQYLNGIIVNCGHLPSNFGVEAKGNSILTEYGWMGFWDIKFEYEFDSRNKTLTKVEKEFYDVNKECEVKTSFKLLTGRDDNSVVAVNLKPKTKLTIVKADITPACDPVNGYTDDMMCDWFLIKTSDGKQGWCRLKDFYENVDGLVWAG